MMLGVCVQFELGVVQVPGTVLYSLSGDVVRRTGHSTSTSRYDRRVGEESHSKYALNRGNQMNFILLCVCI